MLPKTTCKPSKKLSPMMITVVPPVVQPSFGQIALIVGVAVHRKPEQAAKVTGHKAASQPHRGRWIAFAKWPRFATHLIHGSLGRQESAPPPNSISIGSSVFAQLTRVPRQTTERATSVTTGRIYPMHVLRLNNKLPVIYHSRSHRLTQYNNIE